MKLKEQLTSEVAGIILKYVKAEKGRLTRISEDARINRKEFNIRGLSKMRLHRQMRLNHSLYPELSEEGVRRAVVQLGEDLFPAFLKVKRADISGQNPEVREKKFLYMDQVEEIYRRILDRGDCLSLRGLKVSGDDLIGAGIPRGKQVGRILNLLLDEVLTDPAKNERGALLRRAMYFYGCASDL